MIISLFMRALRRAMQNEYLIVDAEREGIIREGQFIPCDFTRYELVDKATHLVLEKGKYRITQKEAGSGRRRRDEPSAMLVIDNSKDSYDRFWGDEEIIGDYLGESRLAFFDELHEACKAFITGRILDIGCGSGEFLKIVASRTPGGKFHGFDFSWSGVLRSRSVLPEGEFVNGDIYATGYRDDSFDTILCIEVLEHLEHPRQALQELARICREDGKLIVTIPNGVYDSYVGHLHFWSESDFRQLLPGLPVHEFRYLENDRTMLFILGKPHHGIS